MIAFDTNILVYVEDQADQNGRRAHAFELVQQLTTGGHCIPLQVFAEFLNVCAKKKFLPMEEAVDKITAYAAIFETPGTTADDLMDAARIQNRCNLQFFDALILTVAARAGATMLLSEDMIDGLEVEGVRIVNPFNPENDAVIAAALI